MRGDRNQKMQANESAVGPDRRATTRGNGMRASIQSTVLSFAAVGLIAGCAEPVEEVNTVQPGYVSKALFEGEWYYRQTIVDASPLQGAAFVGLEGSLEKVRWEITEDTLYAYRTHEAILGLDEDDTQPGAVYKGDPVAAFAISAHFDIKKGYNASTGEENNVIGENQSDRPWYERDYIRVNWNTGPMWGPADIGLTGNYHVPETEVFHPDQLQLTDDYIQVTQIGAISDQETCFYLYGDYNCGTSEVNLRLSFAKIDADEAAKFEPRTYLDNVPSYAGQCSMTEVRDFLAKNKDLQPVVDKALWNRPLGYQNLKRACAALADATKDRNGDGRFVDGGPIRSVTLTMRSGQAIEFACTPEFISFLDEVFAPGYFVARNDCSDVRYQQADRFGVFRTERHLWDRRAGGGRDELREYYANIHNTWDGKVSNTVRINGKDVTVETRLPRPVVYYVNVDYPEDLVETTVRIGQDWDAAFTEMAAAATKLDAVERSWVKDELGRAKQASSKLSARKTELETKRGQLRSELTDLAAQVGRLSDATSAADRARLADVALRRVNASDELADVQRELARVSKDVAGVEKCPAASADADALLEANLDRGCARYIKTQWVREQVRSWTESNEQHPLYLIDGDEEEKLDGYGPEAMFQVRANSCSIRGVEAYLARNPEMADVAEEARGGGELTAGNLEKVCAGLRHFSRERDLDEKFAWQQIGDVRFSFIDWVHEEQPSGPLGFGPSSADPENGHIISGNAHVYGAGVDSYARAAADIVRAMNEDLDLNDVISGASYQQWLDSGKTVVDMENELKVGPEQHRAMNERLGTFDLERVYGAFQLPNGKADKAAIIRNMRRRLQDPDPRDPVADLMGRPLDEGRARLEKVKKDPRIQAMLVDNDTLEVARRMNGWRPGDEVTEQTDELAMDLLLDRKAMRERLRDRFKHFEGSHKHKGCVYLAEFIDDSVIGTALELKGLDPEFVYQRLRKAIYRGVMLHEIGHTVGMTHNFEASFDAINYGDEFWKIFEEFPEDDQEPDRNAAKATEYRYSSIMEYGSRFNSDLHGLGKYDHATIKFVYGGVVEEFDETVPLKEDLGSVVFLDGYKALPAAIGGVENLTKRVDRRVEDQIEARRQGALKNAELLISNADPDAENSPYWISREVPFGYCLDTFQGNLTCRVYDEGATHTEVVESAIQNYWNYYAFNAFRRGRNEYSFLNGYFTRQDRLGEFLTYPFKYYYFFQNYDIGLRNDLYRASRVGLNFINQVLGTPEPGRHCLDTTRNLYVPYGEAGEDLRERCELGQATPSGHPAALDIPIGTGRDEFMRFNDEYYYQIDYVGWYFDKINILQYLTDTSTSFFQVANLGDSRRFSIGFYRLFRPELVKLMGDLLGSVLDGGTGDAFAGLLDDQDQIVPRALVDAAAFGQDPDGMAGRPRIHSPMGYNLLWQGLVLMSLYNTSSFDSEMDFNEYLTITEAGTEEDRAYPDGVDVIEFEHPRSKALYRAAQTGDGRSIAFDLLGRINEFVADQWQPAWDAVNVRNPSEEALNAFHNADRRLGEYMEVVNAVRLLRAAVDTADE